MTPEEEQNFLSEAIAEEMQKAFEKNFGSKSNTPWSAESYTPSSKFGVTVPKTFDEIFVNTSTLRGVISAMDPTSATYASRRQPSDVPNFNALPSSERNLFDAAAKAIHPLKTGQSYYEDLISASWDLSTKGIYKSPQQLAYEALSDPSGAGVGGPGGGGAGAYTGPRTTTSVSVTAKEDVERTLNTFAVDMLGRNLTDDELKKYTAQYREQEMAAPQVTTTQGGGAATTSMTEQTVSRETIAQNILQDNPMFADNVIKTDVLDMFFNRLGGAAGGS